MKAVLILTLLAAIHSSTVEEGDPIPQANGGLGCMTDSECEGLDEPEPRVSDTMTLMGG